MARTMLASLAVLGALAACDPASPPAPAPAPKPAGPQAFFDDYRAAIKSRDLPKLLPMIVAKYRTQMEEDLKTRPEKAKENLEFMCKFQEEALQGCSAAPPKEVDGETHLVYSKAHVTVTVRLLKEAEGWKLVKVAVDDKTPPK